MKKREGLAPLAGPPSGPFSWTRPCIRRGQSEANGHCFADYLVQDMRVEPGVQHAPRLCGCIGLLVVGVHGNGKMRTGLKQCWWLAAPWGRAWRCDGWRAVMAMAAAALVATTTKSAVTSRLKSCNPRRSVWCRSFSPISSAGLMELRNFAFRGT